MPSARLVRPRMPRRPDGGVDPGQAALFHALNHVYDTLRGTGGRDQTLALLVYAGLTLATLWQLVRYGIRSSATVEGAMPSHQWTQSTR
jgi:hypothetical protein